MALVLEASRGGMDDVWEVEPQPWVEVASHGSSRSDGGGMLELARWCCAVQMALVALIQLTNYVYMSARMQCVR